MRHSPRWLAIVCATLAQACVGSVETASSVEDGGFSVAHAMERPFIEGRRAAPMPVISSMIDVAFDLDGVDAGVEDVSVVAIEGATPDAAIATPDAATPVCDAPPEGECRGNAVATCALGVLHLDDCGERSCDRPPGGAASCVACASPIETQTIALANISRIAEGLAPLTCDPRLAAAARAHSADMCARHFFAHDTPDGITLRMRLVAAGVRFWSAGENIAGNQTTPAEVHGSWMQSPMHRANILGNYTRIGLGYSECGGLPRWTTDFAR